MPSNDHLLELSLFISAQNIRTGCEILLRKILEDEGVASSQIMELQDGGKVCVATYFCSRLAAERIHRQILLKNLKNVKVQLKHLKKEDWQEKWKESVRPFRLTEKFDVVPAWRVKEYRRKKREPIIIDTAFAFGTGLHETTRFMSEFIEQSEGQFIDFLDVGTGTGILSIVAYKCGARSVDALDLDAMTVKVAKENLQRNRLKFRRIGIVDFGKLKNRETYDFVAANLLSETLILLNEKLLSRVNRGGHLAISGISLKNLKKVKETFKEKSLRCLKIKKGEKWAALLYKKTS
ncbi:MAG: 50S ribosomal protein L11 methyltransferase [Candidatus Omnitrophica bacterium]|nr:50S ribosomal protein L11 methyltransferase [Candidatus Omnitrophota bacterium]